MIPVGYIAKKIAFKPDEFDSDKIEDIYSVSGCISENFGDYINCWKHNGYWLFDSPEIIKDVARELQVDLTVTTTFYYEAYEFQYHLDERQWEEYAPEKSFPTNVIIPVNKDLEGYDLVSFSQGNSPECSYLSCNHLTSQIPVNQHCLLDRFEDAKALLNNPILSGCEPGPCRIFAVYSLPND